MNGKVAWTGICADETVRLLDLVRRAQAEAVQPNVAKAEEVLAAAQERKRVAEQRWAEVKDQPAADEEVEA